MIGHMSFAQCDECGDPCDMADDAREARAIARSRGWMRIDGRDLCWRCRPDGDRCTTCGVLPVNWLAGCTNRDGIHTAPGADHDH